MMRCRVDWVCLCLLLVLQLPAAVFGQVPASAVDPGVAPPSGAPAKASTADSPLKITARLSDENPTFGDKISLEVTLTLNNGAQVQTTEPSIDLVFRVAQECGTPCADILLVTE